MWIAEVDVEIGGFGDGQVVGHLAASVPGQRTTQMPGQPQACTVWALDSSASDLPSRFPNRSIGAANLAQWHTLYAYIVYVQMVRISLRLLGVWSAVGFFVIWVVGFMVFARWVPPIPPSADEGQIAAMFASRTGLILAGMACMGFGAALYIPWTAVLADLIREIEDRSRFLSLTQIGAGVMSAMTFFLPALIWAAAAFRPQRNPEITQALVDLGWLIFITPIAPFIVQYLTLGIAIFLDKRPNPVFPRWAAYLQIWVSVTFLPGLAAYFFKRGPLAWNGLFVWWIPLTAFTLWFVAMIALTRRAVLASEAAAEVNSDFAAST